jgi:UDP-N-acetylglucosamine 4,6-dehydratase
MASILLVGGSGFIGSHISRYLLDNPEYDRVVILSRDWHKQLALRKSLGNPDKFRWFIGDIRDKDRLTRAFNGIDVIVHAGAIKDQVSSAYNPRETMLTNVVGTQNVIDAAIDCGVKKVLFISSDKGTAPISCYGHSKAMGESLIVAANTYSPNGTRFASCRYGNVVNSASSVLPIFRQQRETGTLSITDPRSTRFWITPEQAVLLIFKSLAEMLGGEVFVPKLPASLIIDLATAVAPEAKIDIIGLRVAEKIHEIMVNNVEAGRTQDVGWGYRIEPEFKFWDSTVAYPSGSPVPWDWTYSSASATRLTVEQLRAMIE